MHGSNDPLGMHGMQQMSGVGFQDQPLQDSYVGGIVDLMTYLKQEYIQFLNLEIEKRKARGMKTMSLEEAITITPFDSFFKFCRQFLSRHRPVQSFPADANQGMMLSNNARIVLCPAAQGDFAGYGGSMQHSGDINITQGQSQPGMNGVVNDGGIKII
jgi:hypothetical protein